MNVPKSWHIWMYVCKLYLSVSEFSRRVKRYSLLSAVQWYRLSHICYVIFFAFSNAVLGHEFI